MLHLFLPAAIYQLNTIDSTCIGLQPESLIHEDPTPKYKDVCSS